MRISELAEATGVSVATIKYYQREGLLPEGRKLTQRLVDYDARHVRRLGLLRLLREVGQVPVEGLKRLVRVVGEANLSIHEMFAAAAYALCPTPPPAGPGRPVARGLADRMIAQAGWSNIRPGSPDRDNLASVLEQIGTYDTHPRDPAEVAPYLRFADEIARYELGHLDDTKDRQGLLEEMVVGQVVFGQLLATLRRLAEEHHSFNRFGTDHCR